MEENKRREGERTGEEENKFGNDASSAWRDATVRVSEIVAFPWDFCAAEDNSPLRRERRLLSSGRILLLPATR